MKAVIKIKNALKKSSLIMSIYQMMDMEFRAILYTLSPKLLVNYRYFSKRRKLPDLKNPLSFDEKLLWLMLYWRHPLKSLCADKYAMRFYVKEHGFDHFLPELLGVYDSPGAIDYDNLPARFVLKCTHGCGFNIICKDKGRLNIEQAKKTLAAWMKIDLSKLAGEIHYAQIKPRIICECFLDDSSGDVPTDYKVYCFHGKAHHTMVCTERGLYGHGTKYDYYDREWKNKLPYSRYHKSADMAPRPAAYDEMIHAADILSRPFPFVRIDFYIIQGKVVIGEMTFTPNACIDTGYTDAAQQSMGELITLPNILMDQKFNDRHKKRR